MLDVWFYRQTHLKVPRTFLPSFCRMIRTLSYSQTPHARRRQKHRPHRAYPAMRLIQQLIVVTLRERLNDQAPAS